MSEILNSVYITYRGLYDAGLISEENWKDINEQISFEDLFNGDSIIFEVKEELEKYIHDDLIIKYLLCCIKSYIKLKKDNQRLFRKRKEFKFKR